MGPAAEPLDCEGRTPIPGAPHRRTAPQTMPTAAPVSPESLVAGYLRAKDENRPHLMPGVFATDATLEMVVRTGTISFPPLSHGIDAITEVLVRGFGRTYENVYTFCLQRPGAAASRFGCDWLVGMSEKATGLPRVGCGRYDWTFGGGPSVRVERLMITIETMQVLPAEALDPVMAWVAALPYPWCPPRVAVAAAPVVDGLEPVLRYVAASRGDAPA